MKKKRVIVAMSGGVDSSVAAALLKEEGYEVMGVTMQIWPKDQTEETGSCCSLSAVEDARRVCHKLGIKHYVMNFRKDFEKAVIKDFIEEYLKGHTPNPCVRCNQFIKFDAFLKKAKQLDADFIATGHHARIGKSAGRYLLKKGKDKNKDQAYFLYPLTQYQLKRSLFPIGKITKAKARKIAAKLGLAVANKPGSQEICFVPNDDYKEFLRKKVRAKIKPGNIVTASGEIIGRHQGTPFYTIGQRKGLGIAAKERLYVIKINPKRNQVVVGPQEETYAQEFIVAGTNFISLKKLTKSKDLMVKIRYNTKAAKATVIPMEGNKVRIRFEKPQKAVTLGQAAVFYQGEKVVGGGTIWQTS